MGVNAVFVHWNHPIETTECILNSPLTESFEILHLTAAASEMHEGIIHGLWHIIQLLLLPYVCTCILLTCQQVNIFFHNSSLSQQVSEPVKWHGLMEFRMNVSNCIKSINFVSYSALYALNTIPVFTLFSCHNRKCFRGLEFLNLCRTGSTRPVSLFM